MAGAPKGNQNARKSKDWQAALRRELHNFESADVGRGEALQKIARKCIEQALSGDQWARTEIANRLDGKPTEHVVGEYTHRIATELTDEQLADIAAGSRQGAADEAPGPAQPPSLQ